MQLRLSHAVLYVRDLEPMLDFYTGTLGFSVSDRGPLDPNDPEGIQVVFMTQTGSDHHQLAFANVRQDEAPSNTLDHLAFRVGSFSDVKEMAAKLQADGRASELGPVNHGNAWSVYFRDPEGNRIEVFCDSPFHVKQPQLDGWDLAMDEVQLREATEKHFGPEADFQPMSDYRSAQERKHGD